MLTVATSGMIMIDRIAVDLPEEPQSGKTQFTKKPIEEHIGGHPANVAICLVKLGMNPQEIGVVAAVGMDSGGRFIKNKLSEYKLRSFLKKVKTPTGQNLILVPKGCDRSFQIAPGANLNLTLDHVGRVLGKERPRVLSIRPGYSGIDQDMAKLLQGLPETFVFLDLMRPFDKEWSYILPALKYTNAVHCNDIEAMNITGENTVSKAARVLLGEGIKILFITRGEGGAKLFTQSKRTSRKAFGVDAVDPTGCGDAFCAGIIKKLFDWNAFDKIDSFSEGRLWDLLRDGQAAGAACATGIGTTAGVSEEKVSEILERERR